MWLKNGVHSLILGAAMLLPLAASADHEPARGVHSPVRGRIEVHVHSDSCRHGPPPGAAHGEGRYELQRVQRWVPGYREKVWVPEVCRETHRHHRRHHHHHKEVCRGGFYEQRWVEGRHETVEEWVWVPAPVHRHGGWRVSASF